MPAITCNIIKKLEELKRTEGSLPPLLEFYGKLLEIQERVGHKIKTPNPVFTKETVKAHAIAGKLLLGFDELIIDWVLLRQAYKEVVALLNEYPELFGVIPQEILTLSPGRVVNKRTVRAWFRGRAIVVGMTATNGTQSLLRAAFAAVLGPFLTTEAAALKGLLEPEMWRRGYCPVCGGNPDFSYLTRETGARWLVCSRCDTEWLFQRVQCPYCENYDQNKLSFFTNDDDGSYRLYVCDQCKHYLKAVDLRQFKDEVLLPLERLTTLDMDRQAQEKGYLPCN
jgi:formate dehydrogenase maturation protein FdhE